MKLFQKLLVAGTALSIIAPVASQASDTVNLEEMNSYVRSEKSSSRFDSKTFVNDVKEGLAKTIDWTAVRKSDVSQEILSSMPATISLLL